MDDRIKSLLYMGVGLAATSKKAKILLDKLEWEGKVTEEEGKRLIDEVIGEIKSEGALAQNQFYSYLDETWKALETPSQRDFELLKKRVESLEAFLKEKGYDIQTP